MISHEAVVVSACDFIRVRTYLNPLWDCNTVVAKAYGCAHSLSTDVAITYLLFLYLSTSAVHDLRASVASS